MTVSADQLAALLDGTELRGRDIVALQVPGEPEGSAPVLAVHIEPEESFAAWQIARSLVERTGRWPIAACAWEPAPEGDGAEALAPALDRIEFRWEHAGPSDPRSILARAAEVDLELEMSRLRAEADWLEVPDVAEVEATAAVAGYMDWFEPAGQPTALLLLPANDSADVLAYLHWFAGDQKAPSHLLVALLRYWTDVAGVELVAHWGTMLQLVVTHPPISAELALKIAVQHELVAQCTTALPGVSIAEHATTLRTADRWFLHERP